MKILFAIKGMDHAKGGAERVMSIVTRQLAGRGHEIDLLSFDKQGGQAFYPLDDRVRRVYVSLGDTRRRSGFLDTCRRIYAIRRLVKRKKPDCVVAFMHSMFVPASIALIGTGIPIIASEHIVPHHYHRTPLQYMLVVLSALFLVARFVVISPKIALLYPRVIRSKISDVANPVHISDAKKPNEKQVKKCGHSILTVGRLDPQKDQACLIRSFAALADQFPEWSLRIIGEGALQQDLEQLIHDLEMIGRITLAGTTKNIAEAYKNADIFAMPSRYESFGMATVEAMSFGLPVVGFSDCPGTNELVVDGYNGLLAVPTGGEDEGRDKALTACLATLMKDDQIRKKYGYQGKDVIKQYSPEKIAQDWEILIKDVIERKDL